MFGNATAYSVWLICTRGASILIKMQQVPVRDTLSWSYFSSRSTVQVKSLRIIISWLSLLPEVRKTRSVRDVDGICCRNLDPVRLGACTFLRSGIESISMALCDCERWLRLPEVFVAVKRDTLLDLVLDRILDNSYSAREPCPVESSNSVVSVVLSPRRNGRILGTVADTMDQ